MKENKFVNLAGLWEATSKSGKLRYASNKMTFAELRNYIKDFKETSNVDDADKIKFLLFSVESSNKLAPELNIILVKDNFSK